MRLALGLVLLGLMSWGCLAIIGGHYGFDLYPENSLLVMLLYWGSPWGALIGGTMLWNKARLWRRLYYMEQRLEPLLRSDHFVPLKAERPSTLEGWALWVVKAGAVALIYWFNLPDPEFLLLAALLVWLFRALVLGALKCQSRP